MKKSKILIFDFSRKNYFKKYYDGKAPSNATYCLNYVDLNNFDLKLINDYHSTKYKFLNNIIYFCLLFTHDIIFSSQYLGFLYLRSFFPKKVKWVLFNINFSVLLKNNKNKKVKYFIIKKAIKKADKIICLSSAQVKDLIEIGVERNKIDLILFGVDNKFYNYVQDNEGYILSVGRDGGRDFETLINTADKLQEKVVIITSKKYFSNLNNLSDNIKIIYDVDHITLRDYYQRAKIVVVPSKDEKKLAKHKLGSSDCSGQTVILEATACGKPVVASKREWMDDYNFNISLYEPENERDLREKIHRAIKNNNNKLSGKLNRKIIDEKLNAKRFGEEVNAIFNKFNK